MSRKKEKRLLDEDRDVLRLKPYSIHTELIQLVENSSRQLRGVNSETCKVSHGALKKEVVEIAEKWHRECDTLALYNLKKESGI